MENYVYNTAYLWELIFLIKTVALSFCGKLLYGVICQIGISEKFSFLQFFRWRAIVEKFISNIKFASNYLRSRIVYLSTCHANFRKSFIVWEPYFRYYLLTIDLNFQFTLCISSNNWYLYKNSWYINIFIRQKYLK